MTEEQKKHLLSLFGSKRHFDFKVESAYYEWVSGDKKYIVESMTRDDKCYKLVLMISDSDCIYTIHKTPWQKLGTEVDEIINAIQENIEDDRMLYQIYFDLYVKIAPDGCDHITLNPLFARFYTDTHYQRSSMDDNNVEFNGSNELWLVCDKNLSTTVIMYCIRDTSFKLVYDYCFLEFDINFDFSLLRDGCNSNNPLLKQIYIWIVNTLCDFYNKTYEKEITHCLYMMRPPLINLIIGYII
jgi:hypothetical protein